MHYKQDIENNPTQERDGDRRKAGGDCGTQRKIAVTKMKSSGKKMSVSFY